MAVTRLANRLRLLVQQHAPEAAARDALGMADQAVFSATNFLTTIIVARATSKADLGLYSLGHTLVLALIGFQATLILVPYTVYSPRLNDGQRRRLTGSTLVHQFAFGTAAALLLAAAAAVMSMGVGPQGLAPVTWAVAATLLFQLLRIYARRVCFALQRVRSALAFDAAVGVLQLGALAAFWRAGRLSPQGAMWVRGIACSVVSLGWLYLMRKQLSIRRAQVLADARRNWSFGRWLFVSGLFSMPSVYVYPWLLAYAYGQEATGILQACTTTVFLVNPFLHGIMNTAAPQAAHALVGGGVPGLRRSVLRTTITLSIGMAGFFLLMVYLGDPVLVTMAGKKYAGYGPVVAVMALGQAVLGISMPVGAGLTVLERPGALITAGILGFVTTMSVGIWLTFAFGPIGAACGLVAEFTAVALARWIAFNRASRRAQSESL